jgi:hypothetical protein
MSKTIAEIKFLLSNKGLTLTYLAEQLEKKLKKPYSIANLSNKLRKGSITFEEIKLIADILGYEVKFVEK